MINTGKEWDWMDECRIHNDIEQSIVEEESSLIEDDQWDHYSGLPNPKWYESE